MERLKHQNQQPDSALETFTGSNFASEVAEHSEELVISDEPNFSTKQTQPGEKIGRYEIINEIGRGGMSIVYKARDNDLNRLVALKLMLKTSNESLNLLRFQKEARAASQLEHPNIVKVHDFNTTDDGTPYLVMSYLDGISLADAIKNEGNFSLERWLSIMIQACNALEHAHQAGIVHRDIKPSNFVLAQEHGDEVVKLVDFGIAKNSFDDMSLTKTGEVFGSPLYMSPEQCAGSSLDARSDIYSLGCVMYEALAGRPPIFGSNALNTLQRHLTDVPDRLSKMSLKTQNIEQLDQVVMKCLEKKPENRYQNLGDLKNDLELLFQGETIRPSRVSAKAISVVVACMTAGIIGVVAFLNIGKINHQPAGVLQPAVQNTFNSKSVSLKSPAERQAEVNELSAVFDKQVKDQDVDGAFKTTDQMSKLAEGLNFSPFKQADNKIQRAVCLSMMKRYADAQGLYEEALALMANPATPDEAAKKQEVLMQFADMEKSAKSYVRAPQIYKSALDFAAKQNDKQQQIVILKCLADCAHGANKPTDCLEYLKQAQQLDPTDQQLQKNIQALEKRLKKGTNE